jgi:redox-sensitive bicupin YhaK (pirin superfamily)
MHGLQLWVALPDEARHSEPRFEHHAELLVLRDGDATIPVLVGRFGSAESPARVHTPLVAVEVVLSGPGSHRLSLEPAFEYGVLTMSGAVDAAGTTVTPGSLLHLAPAVLRADGRRSGRSSGVPAGR